MGSLNVVCTQCKSQIASQLTGTRVQKTINTQVIFPGTCYVADEITFSNGGQLIFKPPTDQGDQQTYAVICRKLIIDGGRPASGGNPCNPSDPGSRYSGSNLITWDGRLKSAAPGTPLPTPAAQPSGSGANGTNGSQGNPGNQGFCPVDVPPSFTTPTSPDNLVVVAIEVEVLNKGTLVIDWAGQDGGNGGPGQPGGNGGSGAGGSNGRMGGWPGYDCDASPGNGQNGGSGGLGGPGGTGGPGGAGGQITVYSSAQNVSPTGTFQNSSIVTFVTQSVGGSGGNGGRGGNGAKGGNPGNPTAACSPAAPGDDGTDNTGVIAATGAPGPAGAFSLPQFQTISAGTCADHFPIQPVFGPGNSLPQIFYRCSAGTASGKLSLIGQFLDQIASVSTTLSGVTITIDPSSTDTQLNLNVSIAANSGTGLGDLDFTYTSPGPSPNPLPGAIEVFINQVTLVAPATGAPGATVAITVTGNFDPTASVFDINPSGSGITQTAVTFVNDTTLTCNFVIDSAAAAQFHDVTVKVGPCTSTLVKAFKVT